MNIKEYLKTSQKVVYEMIKNAFSLQHTSHAYIINGNKGTPLDEIAIFMAQSFVCLNKDIDHLACETCLTCQKIANKTYADFKFIKGEDLKTEAINNLQNDFNKSSIEQGNIQIYIISLIEKAPIASLNKLLKFIEEPTSNIVAIFTTNSLDAILQTIVSRCQIISLKQFTTTELATSLIESGINEEDAYLIAKVSNNYENNLALASNEAFKSIKEILKESLDYLANNDDYFIVYMQTKALKELESNNYLELYLDMLEVCFLEALISKDNDSYKPKFLANEIKLLGQQATNLENKIKEITKANLALLSNANSNLVFDKLLINLLAS